MKWFLSKTEGNFLKNKYWIGFQNLKTHVKFQRKNWIDGGKHAIQKASHQFKV